MQFTPGDRVRVTRYKSYNYGREGVVTEVRPDSLYTGIVVEFEPGDSCLYGPTAIALVDPTEGGS
jgi:hypothetical protein